MSTTNTNDDWLRSTVTLDEACAILGVSSATLHRWVGDGTITLEKHPRVNKRVRYLRSDVEKLAQELGYPTDEEVWDLQMVSTFLDLPTQTVRRLEKRDKLHPVRSLGNQRRWRRSEVERYRDSGDYKTVKARQQRPMDDRGEVDTTDLDSPEGDPAGFVYAETAAQMLGVQRATLRKWEREGKLVAHPRRHNRRVVYTRGTIAEFRNQRGA